MYDDTSRTTYLNVLAEIKHRIAAVDKVLDEELPIAPKVGEELCILQFRMIAELIAIGCLVLHKDLALSKEGTLAKAWNAGQIFRRLASLHQDFFPQPLESTEETGTKFTWVNYTGPS